MLETLQSDGLIEGHEGMRRAEGGEKSKRGVRGSEGHEGMKKA